MSSPMCTIGDVISRLLTSYRLGGKSRVPSQLPWWPPDVFAVVGTLINLSGCYTLPEFTSWGQRMQFTCPKYLVRVNQAAADWQAVFEGEKERLPRMLQQH